MHHKIILIGFFYLVFGIWLASNFKTKVKILLKYKKLIIVTFTISLIILLVSSRYLLFFDGSTDVIITSMRPTVILYSLLFTLLTITYKPKLSKSKVMLKNLSKYSFEIYLSHQLFVNILQNIYSVLNFQINSLVYIILMLIVVSLLSVGVAIIYNQIVSNLTINKTQKILKA